ncbi:MAG TPA: hypothetical protein VM511_07890, partial [Luteolibacter sp.]|nr:hypothetical protein [Luteolibacter sp.]
NMSGFKADSWSDNSQIWWTKGEVGDRLVLRFESAKAGDYEVLSVFTKAHDYGKFRITLNGESAIPEIDLYSNQNVATTGDVTLGRHAIKAGLNELILEILTPNPKASMGNMVGIDHLTLVPAK